MTAAKSDADSLICLGVIVAAHGVRGEVKIKVHGDAPANLMAYGALCDAQGKATVKLRRLRGLRGGAVAEVEGVGSREAAEALRGVEFYVPRAALPEPAADEFYCADLIGLTAIDGGGATLGIVTAVHNFGAGDILEIAGDRNGESLMAPFDTASVPEVDLAKRRVRIDLAAAGLDAATDAAPSPAPDGVTSVAQPRRQKAARP